MAGMRILPNFIKDRLGLCVDLKGYRSLVEELEKEANKMPGAYDSKGLTATARTTRW